MKWFDNVCSDLQDMDFEHSWSVNTIKRCLPCILFCLVAIFLVNPVLALEDVYIDSSVGQSSQNAVFGNTYKKQGIENEIIRPAEAELLGSQTSEHLLLRYGLDNQYRYYPMDADAKPFKCNDSTFGEALDTRSKNRCWMKYFYQGERVDYRSIERLEFSSARQSTILRNNAGWDASNAWDNIIYGYPVDRNDGIISDHGTPDGKYGISFTTDEHSLPYWMGILDKESEVSVVRIYGRGDSERLARRLRNVMVIASPVDLTQGAETVPLFRLHHQILDLAGGYENVKIAYKEGYIRYSHDFEFSEPVKSKYIQSCITTA